uniref:Uncharacterized protein n=1 Tax=Salix viminalis TaxID=40686 RepID=A0A6N2N5S0_SALVM
MKSASASVTKENKLGGGTLKEAKKAVEQSLRKAPPSFNAFLGTLSHAGQVSRCSLDYASHGQMESECRTFICDLTLCWIVSHE